MAARIAAEEHAIVARDGAFVADLSRVGLRARFDDEGVAILHGSSAALELRTLAWGRAGALTDLTGQMPSLGACSAELDAQGHCIRRLEYGAPGVTEWWAGLGAGLEQGWVVTNAPAGEGPLVFVVGVGGAMTTSGSGETLQLTDREGMGWSVAQVEATDASGAPLSTHLEPTEAGLRIEVDVTAARWPVMVDPVYETAAWELTGDLDDLGFGDAASGAGDVNGDGYDDVIIGAPGSSYYHAGRAYLFYGSATGVTYRDPTTLDGEDIGDAFGSAVAGVGDVDGDGYDDVIVGAPGHADDTGRVYVFHGSSSGLMETAATVLDGESMGDAFGAAAADAGDVNGDGYADVVVGAYGSVHNLGRAYIYHGSASGVSDTAAITLPGESIGDEFGSSVAGAHDVDADGYDDVIIGAPGHGSAHGRVYVYHGASGGLSSAAGTTLDGESTDDDFGSSVAGAGDVDSDGYDDVIVGATGYSDETGRVYIYHGSASGVSGSATTTLTGDATGDALGSSVSGVGDVNGDGYDDVVLGATGYGIEQGRATVFLGSASGVSDTVATTLTGDSSYDRFGVAVSGAGDVDGDGYDDLLVGAASDGCASDVGCVGAYIFGGTSSGVSDAAEIALTGGAVNYLGQTVSTAGDVNGDGYDDVIVGAHGYLDYVGRAYVFPGSASGLSDTAMATLTGDDRDECLGRAVSWAGDVNADGYDDVIVGAYGCGSGAGRAHVLYGSPGGVSEASMTTLSGLADAEGFGFSVAAAGDVDGDGYDDVIVGACTYSATAESQAFVFAGSATGVSETATTTLTGEEAGDDFGCSVSGAGDVNGDGYDDVIVGAMGHGSGRAYVFHGSASGLSESAATTLGSSFFFFGYSVSGAGDVNGDGYDDVIVGAWLEDDTGQAYVFLGSEAGVSTSVATTLKGEADSGYFGYSVSGAGDLDQDGYDDVIVGSWAFDGDAGRAYVYSGSPRGVSDVATTTLDGETRLDDFGISVSRAGDVDGDGFDDVIVGASGYDYGKGRAYVYRGHQIDEDGDEVSASIDCDDGDAGIGEPSSRYVDEDGDGYGSANAALACPGESGYSDTTGDCDDADANVNPGAAELCDAVDDDCDGTIDQDAADAATWYPDLDADGYTSPDGSVLSCDAPSHYGGATEADCDDMNAEIHPGAEDLPGDGIDQDCDGLDAELLADDTGDTLGADKGGGCGCASENCPPTLGWSGMLLALVTLRRRSGAKQ